MECQWCGVPVEPGQRTCSQCGGFGTEKKPMRATNDSHGCVGYKAEYYMPLIEVTHKNDVDAQFIEWGRVLV